MSHHARIPSNEPVLDATAAWNSLPPPWRGDAAAQIRLALASNPTKLVVIDDDPTGTQTVHDIAVLTTWDVTALAEELSDPAPACYILTNSRSLPADEAYDLNLTIARNLLVASESTGKHFAVVSRGDSTLRGHFPQEIDALTTGLRQPPDGILLIPFFGPGGRFTLNDIHYLSENGCLIPVAGTPYAQDPVFGYHSSNLRRWVEEKTAGRIAQDHVRSISIADIRTGGPERVVELLSQLEHAAVCVVNVATAADLEVFTAGLLQAESLGRRFLYRTAASFVPVRAGQLDRPLLDSAELAADSPNGALFIAGSFVPCTTAQIDAVLSAGQAVGFELDVSIVLHRNPEQVISSLAHTASLHLAQGANVVVYSSRERLECDGGDFLRASHRISTALVEFLRRITVRPRCLIAKGGITASDLATAALGVRKARILGQVLPGVPVWRLGQETRFPGLSYVVFPGNVGDRQALLDICRILTPRS